MLRGSSSSSSSHILSPAAKGHRTQPGRYSCSGTGDVQGPDTRSPRCSSLRLSPRRCTRSSSEELKHLSQPLVNQRDRWVFHPPVGAAGGHMPTTASSSLPTTSALSVHRRHAGRRDPSAAAGLLASPSATGAMAQPSRGQLCPCRVRAAPYLSTSIHVPLGAALVPRSQDSHRPCSSARWALLRAELGFGTETALLS